MKKSAKVLIVEDSNFLQFALGNLFNKAGCEVLCARSFDEAVAVMEKLSDIDIATLDGQLLDAVHGKEVAAYIVNTYWSRQDAAGLERTAFVTLSGTKYEVEGASSSYLTGKGFTSMLNEMGVMKWIRNMKFARFAMPVRPAKTDTVSVLDTSTVAPIR